MKSANFKKKRVSFAVAVATAALPVIGFAQADSDEIERAVVTGSRLTRVQRYLSNSDDSGWS